MSKQFPPLIWVRETDIPFMCERRDLPHTKSIHFISATEHAHLMEEKQKRIEKLKEALKKITTYVEVIDVPNKTVTVCSDVWNACRETLAAEGKE